MGLHLYSIHHRVHGLEAVERVTPRLPGLARACVDSTDLPVRGALVLSTCNRLELLLDVLDEDDATSLQTISDFVDTHLGADHGEEGLRPAAYHHADAVRHVFDVAAGLDSMVVGEREISGQLRRALTVASQEKTASALIHRVVQSALHTSRKVAHLTGLASAGRSVVGVGLDVVADLVPPLRTAHVVLIGTGSYAGASVAGLHERGCMNIAVHSTSAARARVFADGHDLRAVPVDGLHQALVECDLAVSCRGLGSPVLRAADIAEVVARRRAAGNDRDLVILDLALMRDAETEIREVDGARLINLHDVQRAVPDVGFDQVARAIDLVREGVADLARELEQRRLDPAIVALREMVRSAVEEEVERLPAGETLPRDLAEHALYRLAARLAHVPTTRAHQAAVAGQSQEYVDALRHLLGITVEVDPPLSPQVRDIA
ncbi:MAG: glutamyl-tRNA reductase [Bowdeniella nasicola]|nr:glutamyl-tRNA reductase [Bowdeniella nasicola]